MTDFRATDEDPTDGLDLSFDHPHDLEPEPELDLSADADADAAGNLEELPLRAAPRRARSARSRRSPRAARRGPARVDAWSEPAPASWSRTRRIVRKVRRESRGTDWALPF